METHLKNPARATTAKKVFNKESGMTEIKQVPFVSAHYETVWRDGVWRKDLVPGLFRNPSVPPKQYGQS